MSANDLQNEADALLQQARANGSVSELQQAFKERLSKKLSPEELRGVNLDNIESTLSFVVSRGKTFASKLMSEFRALVSAGENLQTLGIGMELFTSSALRRGMNPVPLKFPLDVLPDESNPQRNSSRVEIDIIGNSNAPVLTDTIALYMPPDIQARYTAKWQDDALGGLASAGAEISGAASQIASNTSQGAGVVSAGANLFDSVFFKNRRERQSRQIVNPHKALLYQSHDFRTISIDWQLFAKNQQESAEIKKIIQKLKEASHSGLGGAGGTLGTTFTYPDEMMLRFYTNGQSDYFMFSFGPCVITNLTIKYGPGQAAFFHDTGAPVQVDLSIEFQEVFMLTREHIKQNY